MSGSNEYWGISSTIDLYECDLALMQNADAIREFVKTLCDRIKMRRYGETQVVFFGDDPRVTGFSMTQLIETSLISALDANARTESFSDRRRKAAAVSIAPAGIRPKLETRASADGGRDLLSFLRAE